jgi:hypothetical protein
MESSIFQMKEERKKNRYWLLPVHRTGVPGGGRAGSQNLPPVKWKHRDLSERHEQTGSGVNSLFVRHQERKRKPIMQTVVVNIHKEPFDVYIGRRGRGQDGYFGNPFRIGPGMSREDAVERFERYFVDRIEKDSEFKRRILALKGKRLGCFCKPKACHGDVIVDWLNKMEPKEVE